MSIGAVVETAIDPLFALPEGSGTTAAVVVTIAGEVVAERYAPGVSPEDTQPSWSMAKSMLHAAVGLAGLDEAIDEPAPVAAWHASPGDPRAAITLDHLLRMASGLRWTEDYVDGDVSDVIAMLFGTPDDGEPTAARYGRADMGAFAASFPLADGPPGSRFLYSSGTSNIVSRLVADRVGRGESYERFLRDRLFGPLGMTSATPKFDRSGVWVGSSFCFCTPRDFARFGNLYLRGGDDLLPDGWAAHAIAPSGPQPEPGAESLPGYGAHWWLDGPSYGRVGGGNGGGNGGGAVDAFVAAGYEGQYVWVVPSLELVVVRSGRTPAEGRPPLVERLRALVAAVASA